MAINGGLWLSQAVGIDRGMTSSRVEIYGRRTVLEGFLSVEEAELRFERYDGTMSRTVRRMSVHRGNSVAAVIVKLPERDVLLVEQFKFPTFDAGPGWIVELVAGMVDEGESEPDAIRREIREEIGHEVAAVEQIADFYLSPGGSSERVTLFYAEVSDATVVDAGGGAAGSGEDIVTRVVAHADVEGLVASGGVHDAKTLVGLQWLLARWAR